MNTAILILAAGSSIRLGEPKQLLPFKNKKLINHIADEARTATAQVLVITGAEAEAVSAALKSSDVNVLFNADWEQGQGTGIAAGVKALMKHSDYIITSVCDQPFLTGSIFRLLIAKAAETGKGIVACAYEDTVGTPVLFHEKYFADLLNLSGNEGAKKLLSVYQDDLAVIDFPAGGFDIDTKEDLAKLKKATN